jgi:hypothetical protein
MLVALRRKKAVEYVSALHWSVRLRNRAAAPEKLSVKSLKRMHSTMLVTMPTKTDQSGVVRYSMSKTLSCK